MFEPNTFTTHRQVTGQILTMSDSGTGLKRGWIMNKLIAAATAATLFGGLASAAPASGSSAKQAPVSAQTSNPQTMGWMQGFPSAPDKTIRFTDPAILPFRNCVGPCAISVN